MYSWNVACLISSVPLSRLSSLTTVSCYDAIFVGTSHVRFSVKAWWIMTAWRQFSARTSLTIIISYVGRSVSRMSQLQYTVPHKEPLYNSIAICFRLAHHIKYICCIKRHYILKPLLRRSSANKHENIYSLIQNARKYVCKVHCYVRSFKRVQISNIAYRYIRYMRNYMSPCEKH